MTPERLAEIREHLAFQRQTRTDMFNANCIHDLLAEVFRLREAIDQVLGENECDLLTEVERLTRNAKGAEENADQLIQELTDMNNLCHKLETALAAERANGDALADAMKNLHLRGFTTESMKALDAHNALR
jgi:hypothetical protein